MAKKNKNTSSNKEIIIVGITLSVFFSLIFFASIFDVAQNTFVGKMFNVRRYGGTFMQNCQNPENKNSPYCQDRMAEKDSTWKSMTSGSGGGGQFTLHKR